jgi:hypothetical protein
MPKRLRIELISAVLAVSVSSAMAQRGGGHGGFARGVNVSFGGRPFSHSYGRGAIFLGDPFYADYPVAPVTIPSQYVVTQATTTIDAAPEAKSEPLMIELQGNKYVRFGGTRQSAERGMNSPPDYAEAQANSSSAPQPPPPRELPPTVLIFHDGHREQIPEYAIVGSTLYASGTYWQSGQWTKNIQLSQLDIPATIQANHASGVKFILPSAPNEVVTRP